MSTEWLWGIGIIVLGIAIAYALMRNRTRSAAEKRTTERVTKENYRAEDVKEGVRPMPE
ncbi:hypothetical protein BJ123_11494 [Rhodopseudomonas thermotolerans]|jgi:uncharacterized membrane-anchored protein YhcB (DUF1043 family)|uniref:Uncharacterized protein n=2 Tax=Rhodopseudomonas TaxID=1073 RepID=A0A336JW47_9BRAD|nr:MULTISPECIES: hypothetical protein [Rhodopseudomonas]RED31854.1 hypothetical protein BJ125_11494 [Rhodopseudomonas pentothenatexigens]REF93155.1 hypothetical protein BJ123_11494 [Rhodopseudomonas thermotolerans]SSW91834.1 hypothetical protein SAMN05892882_11494 [Rhodopseudomonas pentothenatexigens]